MLGETLSFLPFLGPGLDTAHRAPLLLGHIEEAKLERQHLPEMKQKAKGDQQTKFVSRKGTDKTWESQITAEMSRGWRSCLDLPQWCYQSPRCLQIEDRMVAVCRGPSVGADRVASRVPSSSLFAFCRPCHSTLQAH